MPFLRFTPAALEKRGQAGSADRVSLESGERSIIRAGFTVPFLFGSRETRLRKRISMYKASAEGLRTRVRFPPPPKIYSRC